MARNKIKSKVKISKWIQQICIKNEYYGFDESHMSQLNATRVSIYDNKKITLTFSGICLIDTI